MTFFANSGVAWPNLQLDTAVAGQMSLEAASDMWALVAMLENPRGAVTSFNLTDRAADAGNKFKEAADQYRKIAARVDDKALPALSPAELDLASLDGDTAREFGQDSVQSRLMPSPRSLYEQLAKRLETLASRLMGLNFQKADDLHPGVFKLMRDWESLTTLGRLIAVANLRPRKP